AFAASREAAGLAAGVAREAAVVRAGLAVVQVELDAEHGLRAAHRELEVRTEARARVPLMVAVTSEVAVVDVPSSGRDLVEGPGDRHLRRRGTCGRLREDWQCRYRQDDEGEYCGENTSPHCTLLGCGEKQHSSAPLGQFRCVGTNRDSRPGLYQKSAPRNRMPRLESRSNTAAYDQRRRCRRGSGVGGTSGVVQSDRGPWAKRTGQSDERLRSCGAPRHTQRLAQAPAAKRSCTAAKPKHDHRTRL